MPEIIIDMQGRKPVEISKNIKKYGVKKAVKDAIKKGLETRKEVK
jgi:hypothetical protein